MKRIILGTLLLLLPLVCFGQDQPLQLTIKSDKEVYEIGEQIALSIVFNNKGKEPISLCKYFLEHKLLEGIEFKKQEEVVYKMKDFTKYELPIVSEDDFVSLNPNTGYKMKLQIDTVFPTDSAWFYIKPFYTSEGEKALPSGAYQSRAVYENVAGYFQESIAKNGYITTSNIPVKNAWTGTLISNTITIEVTEKKNILKETSTQHPPKIIKRSVGQGDYVRDERNPAEACNLLIQEVRDSNPGMDCKLINSGRVDSPEKFAECVDGATVAGCFTCIFECK